MSKHQLEMTRDNMLFWLDQLGQAWSDDDATEHAWITVCLGSI